MKNILLILLIIAVTSCADRKKATNYTILKEDTGIGYSDLDIRINTRLNKQQIIDIATELRENQADGLKVKILFFLPNQVKGINIPYGFVFYASDPDILKTNVDKDNNGNPVEIELRKE